VRRLVFTPTAEVNLVEIQEYIARRSGNIATAEAFVTQLVEYCEHLATLPGTMGRDRSELLPDLRSVAFKGYVIFIRYFGDENLEIVHILEGHRDITGYFAKRRRT
jgi:plasmid stabilization system protein ParE